MSVLFHECSVLIFISMFLFPEGQTGEACECSKKQYVFVNRGASDKKVLLLFLVSFNLLNVTFFFLNKIRGIMLRGDYEVASLFLRRRFGKKLLAQHEVDLFKLVTR